ncbi:MAG: hypothetical protein ACRBFS_16765 [Aureispira sp.]
MTTPNNTLTLVNRHLDYNSVHLMAPTSHHFVHLAAVLDTHRFPFFIGSSRPKKQFLQQCKNWCQQLERVPNIVSAVVFKAILLPPGSGMNSSKNNAEAFDVSVLIEVKNVEELTLLDAFQALKKAFEQHPYHHVVQASNARRIGPVDHQKQGVFLFNYFKAVDLAQNLGIWEYTAGWFEEETNLDNSTLLLPLAITTSPYSVINHCRWNHLRDILPSLIFKSSFQKYVLDNFKANQVVAQPILYKIA